MKNTYNTPRLRIDQLHSTDDEFMLELVNTAGWLRFIGDRIVHTAEEARAYIQRINDNPLINYWVVKSIESGEKLGVVTFIKRDYLPHHDIGFAFLPKNSGNGYAQEAAMALLQDVVADNIHRVVVATTLADNTSSIRLLTKLGFRFVKEIKEGETNLLLYAIPVEEIK